LEKDVDPDGREELEPLAGAEDGRLADELDVLPVGDGLLVADDAVLLVSPDLLVADVADAELALDADVPVVPPGRLVLEPAAADPLLAPGVLELPVEAGPEVPALPGFVEPVELSLEAAPDLAPTFSAVRSMVTGRFDGLLEDADELPGLSDDPDPLPLPLEEDVPPEDFLSVAISSPPEPCRSQDIHYTHLFAKRYRCGKEFCALQKNDSPGSG